MRRARLLPALITALSAGSAACTLDTINTDPIQGAFHYPIAAAISPSGDQLYVVNSNFNLTYTAGQVNVVDLARVRDQIPLPPESRLRPALCAAPVVAPGAPTMERRNADAFCESAFITPRGNTDVTSVRIGTFATTAALSADGSRLYITVRGDGTLTWIDLRNNGASLDCVEGEGEPNFAQCDEFHRRAPRGSTRGSRMLTMPPLPVAIDVGADGFIAVAHQETPRSHMSLFVDRAPSPRMDGLTVDARGPDLAHWIPELSPNLNALLRLPDATDPANPAAPPRPRWWALSRNEPFANHVNAVPDTESLDRSYLVRQMLSPLVGVASDVGIRQIVRDPCDARFAYATSRAAPPDPGSGARSGDQLLKIDLTDPTNPIVIDALGLPAGPSQLVAFNQARPACTGHTMLYTVSYDARKLYAIDAADWRVVEQIRTQAGPNTVLLDPQFGRMPGRKFLYVVDFVAMCVEVVDLDPASPTFNQVVFTVGDIVPTQVML